MIINRTGATRIVLLTDNYAIKIPNFLSGWKLFVKGILANLNEREFWTVADPRYKQWLCPIVWGSWGAWIVVMKRANRKPDMDPRLAFKELEHVVGDHKEDNYGMLDGRVVMIDYGSD